MKSNLLKTVIVTTATAIAAALFSGCEDFDTYSQQNDDTTTHQTYKPRIDEGAVSDAQLTTFDGTIKELGEGTLRLANEDGTERDFTVVADTAITLNDQPATFGELAAGQAAKIVATVQEDLLTARRIDARSETDDGTGDGDSSGDDKTLLGVSDK